VREAACVLRTLRELNLPKRLAEAHVSHGLVVAKFGGVWIRRARQWSLKSEVALRVSVARRRIAYLTVDERSIELRTDLEPAWVRAGG